MYYLKCQKSLERRKDLFRQDSQGEQEDKQSTWGKPAEASLNWNPIVHTVPGPGMEPMMHWCKVKEVPLRCLLTWSLSTWN